MILNHSNIRLGQYHHLFYFLVTTFKLTTDSSKDLSYVIFNLDPSFGEFSNINSVT